MALPNELILDICGYLANPDLKACRFVSKSWSDSASVYLFSKIYISPRKEDIDVFNLITQHEQFSRCVRTLEYDGTRFSSGISEYEYVSHLSQQVKYYSELYQTCLGNKDTEFTKFIKSCLKKPSGTLKDFMGSDFILEGHREWENRDAYQRRIVMNGEFLKILKCGLGKLELLNFVEITGDWPTWKLHDLYLTGDLNHSYFYGSPFGRTWQLSHPRPNRCVDTGSRRICRAESDWVEVSSTGLVAAPALRSTPKQTTNMHIFEIITTALSQTQKHLRSFAMFRLSVSVFDPNLSGVIKNGSISAYSSLEHLVLGFSRAYWTSNGEPPNLAAIQALLRSMRGLRSLQLSVPSDRSLSVPPSHKHWRIFPPDGTQWIALTKLQLFGFKVNVKNLCHLLKIMMPNLRELRFREVELLEGRWEGVVEFLKTSMHLLSFPTQENWRLYHQRGELFPAGLPVERSAIGKDIENYVVNGGRHPYLRADESDSASTKYLSDHDL